MKKSVIVLLIMLILVTGCGKKEEKNGPSPAKEDNKTVILKENEYISLKDNQVHKYTFTYPDEETCVKLGDNEPYEVVYPVKPYAVFGCEEIKDANGNILWGEFFYEYADKESIFYY